MMMSIMRFVGLGLIVLTLIVVITVNSILHKSSLSSSTTTTTTTATTATTSTALPLQSLPSSSLSKPTSPTSLQLRPPVVKLPSSSLSYSTNITCSNDTIQLYTRDSIANANTNTTTNTTTYDIVSKKLVPFTLIDTIIFYNEIDILLIRLHELDNVVDKFIIVEAIESFTGLKKEKLIYPTIENDTRLQAFKHKISYYVCKYDTPDLKVQININPLDKRNYVWSREFFMRNVCVKKALEVSNITTAHQNHLVVLGDIDEIPSSSGLNVLKWCNIKSSDNDTYFGYRPQMMSFVTNRLHFNFHCRSRNMGNWNKPSVVPMISLIKRSIRDIRKETKFDFAIKGGWHLSNFYFDSISLLKEKYDSFSHTELKTKFENTLKYWTKVSANGGSKETNTECYEVDEYSLPRLIMKNYQNYTNVLNNNQIDYLKSLQ